MRKLRGNQRRHRRRVDSYEVEIKQSMNIRTQQQSIRGNVGVLSLIRMDMCCLKNRKERTPGDSTGIFIGSTKRFAET